MSISHPVVRAGEVDSSEITVTIKIGDGAEMMAFPVGRTRITVTLQVTTPTTVDSARFKVDSIRCRKQIDLSDIPWQPFSNVFVVPHTVQYNWQSFTFYVQVRDDRGDVSQVFCKSVVIEGIEREMSTPTPAPSPTIAPPRATQTSTTIKVFLPLLSTTSSLVSPTSIYRIIQQ